MGTGTKGDVQERNGGKGLLGDRSGGALGARDGHSEGGGRSGAGFWSGGGRGAGRHPPSRRGYQACMGTKGGGVRDPGLPPTF